MSFIFSKFIYIIHSHIRQGQKIIHEDRDIINKTKQRQTNLFLCVYVWSINTIILIVAADHKKYI